MRSSNVKRVCLPGLIPMAMISWSKRLRLDIRVIMSMCPLVMGSKLPGKTAIFDKYKILALSSHCFDTDNVVNGSSNPTTLVSPSPILVPGEYRLYFVIRFVVEWTAL